MDSLVKEKTTSKDTKGKKEEVKKDPKALNNIETKEIYNITDQDLIGFSFLRDMNGNKNKDQIQFFDTIDSVPVSVASYGTGDINRSSMLRNTRWITFNIPTIDMLSRSNPLVKKAVNYLSSKPLMNGIDINSKELDTEEVYKVMQFFKNLYSSLRQWLSKGINYGGSGGILWFTGDDNRDLTEPLVQVR